MKNLINKANYEQYAIDYIDNNLPADLKKDFELFLEQNSEIKQEIDEIKSFEIEQQHNVVLQDKCFLKKSPIEQISYIDYLLIGKIENQLNRNELKEFNNLLSNNLTFAQDFLAYQKSILPKTQNIKYPFKNNLKKSSVVELYTKRILQLAAVFAFLFAIFYFFETNKNYNNQILTAVNSNVRINTYKIPTVSDTYQIIVKQTVAIKHYAKNNVKNTKIVSQLDSDLLVDQQIIYTQEPIESRTNIVLSSIAQDKLVFREQNNSIGENINLRTARQLPEIKPTTVLNVVLEGLYWLTESDRYVQVDKDKNANKYAVQVNKTKYWLVVK
mgnify:CR=1 FL=1